MTSDLSEATIKSRAMNWPGLLPDHEIDRLAIECGMISPYEPGQVRAVRTPPGHATRVPCAPTDPGAEKIVSYGTSSYGYDARTSRKFRVFTMHRDPGRGEPNYVIDPKKFDPTCFVDVEGDNVVIPPNSFALTSTVEWFKIPRDVLTICLGKSTYARCGIIVNVTPLEPEWEGHVTIEFSNTTPLPARVYAEEGIAQFLFFRAAAPCRTSYADKGGKYQGQSGITNPKV